MKFLGFNAFLVGPCESPFLMFFTTFSFNVSIVNDIERHWNLWCREGV